MHVADLHAISREGGGDFQVILADSTSLYCEEVVRHVPARRLVCRGIWENQAVYAKIFVGRDFLRYAARDAAGARALADRGVPTPQLLHEAPLADSAGRVLIYARVPDSQNAEEAWRLADTVTRLRIATGLVEAVARQHEAGLLQTDLYPRNFLLAAQGIYSLDGDGIRIFEPPLGKRRSLDNLALLFSKFDALDDDCIPEMLKTYASVRAWTITESESAGLLKKVQKTRFRVAKKFVLMKVLRECTEIRVEHSWHRFAAITRDGEGQALLRLVEKPDQGLLSPHARRLKSGNTCTVALVQSEERELVIKRYNIKGFWHGVTRAWRASRGSVSWANAHLLRAFEVATPRPLALIESRWGPFRREAWFITEYVAGPDIDQQLNDPTLSPLEKAEIATAVARLLYKLRRLGIEHGDLKASNMKCVGGIPLLLDLDAMRMHRHEFILVLRHARDLRRFLKNWHNAPDILRILKSALKQVYGSDPVLKRAGVDNEN